VSGPREVFIVCLARLWDILGDENLTIELREKFSDDDVTILRDALANATGGG